MSLSDNIAFMTAVGNDLSFDHIFSRQLENVVSPGDVVILISGSGNSPNLLLAAELARAESEGRRPSWLRWREAQGAVR